LVLDRSCITAKSRFADAIQNDPDTEVKKKAAFALSQLPKDDGVPKLIEVAAGAAESGGSEAGVFLAGAERGSAGAFVYLTGFK
jgi:hypothetical protein